MELNRTTPSTVLGVELSTLDVDRYLELNVEDKLEEFLKQ